VSPSDADALLARLAVIPTANAKQILRELGVTRTVISGAQRVSSELRIAGRARTIRYLPGREDAKPPSAGVNRALIDSLAAGDVVVAETGGWTEGAVLGDMLAARSHARGAAGFVTDGVVRDLDGIREIGLPVWSRGTFPDSNVGNMIPWDCDLAIRCGGTLVLPGDFILADRDAAMVVPPAYAERLLERAELLALEDEFAQQLLRGGAPLADAYPIPASRREEFERFARDRRL
jgi:5-oxopent-3-ene-1,2,5-tricarboxylate decarboxylase/2-hydroxyhepta-2,4-diene-1,7-dioate isomerase